MAKPAKTPARGARKPGLAKTPAPAARQRTAAATPARAAKPKPKPAGKALGKSVRAGQTGGKTPAAKTALARVRLPKPAPRAAAKTAAPAKPSAAPSPAPKPVASAPARAGVAPGSPWMIPALVVRTAELAIGFYERAFGFAVDFTMPGPTGAIAYAQMRHEGGLLQLSPEGAYGGTARAPVTSRSECPVTIYVYCADVDALVARARAAGATILSEPADMFWGDRMASLADPEGYRWAFATHIAPFDPTRAPPAGYPNGKGS